MWTGRMNMKEVVMPLKATKQDQMIELLRKIYGEMRSLRILMSTGQAIDPDSEPNEQMEEEIMQEQESMSKAFTELFHPDDPLAPQDASMAQDGRGF